MNEGGALGEGAGLPHDQEPIRDGQVITSVCESANNFAGLLYIACLATA